MGSIVSGYFGWFHERFRRNWPGYLRENAVYLGIAALAAIADFASTWRFMAAGHIDDEFHPVIRLVSQTLGPFVGPLVGKLGQFAALVALTILFRRWAPVLFLTVTFIYLYAAWYNTWGIHLYTPVFLKYLGG